MSEPGPGPTTPLRVVIVDADDRLRESLSGLLAIGERLEVVGNAGQVGSALDRIAATRPDVVIVDPRLPDAEAGTAFIAQVRARFPAIRILAMGWSDTLESMCRGCGADGFLRKTFRPADLIAAIVAGHRPLDPDGPLDPDRPVDPDPQPA